MLASLPPGSPLSRSAWSSTARRTISLGEVVGWVHDLEAAWRRERELRRVTVSDRDSLFMVEADVPLAPPVVWDFVTDPTTRPRFMPGVVRIDETVSGGRRGVGTTNHCVHGDGATIQEILDWRPYDYLTIRNVVPDVASWVAMEELVPVDDGAGTQVRIRIERPKRARDRAAVEAVHDFIEDTYRQSLVQLREVLRNRAAAQPE